MKNFQFQDGEEILWQGVPDKKGKYITTAKNFLFFFVGVSAIFLFIAIGFWMYYLLFEGILLLGSAAAYLIVFCYIRKPDYYQYAVTDRRVIFIHGRSEVTYKFEKIVDAAISYDFHEKESGFGTIKFKLKLDYVYSIDSTPKRSFISIPDPETVLAIIKSRIVRDERENGGAETFENAEIVENNVEKTEKTEESKDTEK